MRDKELAWLRYLLSPFRILVMRYQLGDRLFRLLYTAAEEIADFGVKERLATRGAKALGPSAEREKKQTILGAMILDFGKIF